MEDLIGRNLGPYRIVEQIGAGGMATVYKAFQPAMNRYVAIKVLPQHLARDPNFRTRFQREANVIAQLEHRYILPVYDVAEDAGIPFLVMRYTDGGTLADLIADGSLTFERAIKLVGQVAEALAYAHRQGVIHRDIKPANILIGRDGNALLSDFGIAKILEDTFQTSGYGVAIGTPAYMAPEQAQGEPVDARSDIYALGVVLYQALTGEPPFTAETPLAVMLMHLHNPLRPPRQINPAIPEELEQVILRALAKEPDDRFQTADEMAAALLKTSAPATVAPPVARAEPIPTPQTVPIAVPVQPMAPSEPAAPAATRRSARTWLLAGAAGAIALIVGVLVLRGLIGPGPAIPTVEPTAAPGVATRPTTVEVDVPVTPGAITQPTSARAPEENVPPGAFAIKIGDTVADGKPGAGAGNIETPGARDVYTFSATAGQQVFFQLKAHEGLTYVGWRLVDDEGTLLFDQCLGCGEVGAQTLKRGGTYTLSVGSDAVAEIGTYQFEIVPQQ